MDELIAVCEPLELTVTVACDGNRRKELNLERHTRGFHWGPGACSTAVWKGIRIASLIEACGGLSCPGNAKYIHFTGADDLAKGKYSTSVPLSLLPGDAMVAFEMNGERLTPDHGFPLRAMLPGFVGGRMVKWLERIELSDTESSNYYHLRDNKVLPYPQVGLETAEQSEWWTKPEFVLYDQVINSVIASPAHEEWLEISDGTFEISGFAYTGGGRVINRVEISLDNGRLWTLMQCTFPRDSVSDLGHKSYAWCHWSGSVSIFSLVRAKSIVVRAWDQSNHCQPRDRTWNVLGMLNNSWYKVKISVSGEQMRWLTFKHPTLPGSHIGGWLATKFPHARTPVLVGGSGRRRFTCEEVKKHNKPEDLWIVVDGCVVDLTAYLSDHPGGLLPILLKGGDDASLLFHEIHGLDAFEIMERFIIGELSQVTTVSKTSDFVLDAKKWITATLKEKRIISHDTRRFVFQLSESKKVGLPIGQHVLGG